MEEKSTTHKPWSGGVRPFEASYGKLMMWFFLISDALTFSGFLCAYGFMRFKYIDVWPVAEDVFTHFPGLHGDHPLLFVALMTFILIMSSVTMVLAVSAGHKGNKNAVVLWMALTIIGGFTFLASQAWEWGHFIHGDKGAIELSNHDIVHLVDKDKHLYSVYELMGLDSHAENDFTIVDVQEAFEKREDLALKMANKTILSHEASKAYFHNSELVLKLPLFLS